MKFRITQQESVCKRTNSISYTNLSETEIAQYNSLKSQNLEIQFSTFKQRVIAVDQDIIRTTSESNLLG